MPHRPRAHPTRPIGRSAGSNQSGEASSACAQENVSHAIRFAGFRYNDRLRGARPAPTTPNSPRGGIGQPAVSFTPYLSLKVQAVMRRHS
jgi:hypothetical protein